MGPLLALALLGCEAADPPPATHPDVLLVVLDTVRADRLSAHGAARPTSLQLAEVARAGVLFEQATAPGSWTWPVHASLFTGTPPWVHGAHFPALGEASGEGFPAMRADLPTLAERFGEAGYRTVSLSANCLLAPELGLVRGFGEARCLDLPGQVEAALDGVLADRSRPVFLFVNLMPAHAPYSLTPTPWAAPHAPTLADPPAWLAPYIDEGPPLGVDLQRRAEGDDKTGIQRILAGELVVPPAGWALIGDLYDGELVEADRRLMDVLGRWNAAVGSDAVVAVTSDHGEHLGERGLVDHRGSVYSPLTHVPLVVAAPGRLSAGQRVSRPVSLVDLGDTLLRLAGVDAPGPGLLAGPAAPVAAMAWPDPYRARKVGGRWERTWRLWRDGDAAVVLDEAGTVELYDLVADPLMRSDLAGDEPARAAALADQARAGFAEAVTGDTRAAGGQTRERLEALGYLEPGP